MAVKVVKDGKVLNVNTVLVKGDLVELENGDIALIGATQEGTRQLVDLTYTVGNYWGDDFKQGTTVAEFNRTHGMEIVDVFEESDYEITINLKGGRN